MKQYTESELRAAFEAQFTSWKDQKAVLARDSFGEYLIGYIHLEWQGWFECARFLGAIKTDKGE